MLKHSTETGVMYTVQSMSVMHYIDSGKLNRICIFSGCALYISPTLGYKYLVLINRNSRSKVVFIEIHVDLWLIRQRISRLSITLNVFHNEGRWRWYWPFHWSHMRHVAQLLGLCTEIRIDSGQSLLITSFVVVISKLSWALWWGGGWGAWWWHLQKEGSCCTLFTLNETMMPSQCVAIARDIPNPNNQHRQMNQTKLNRATATAKYFYERENNSFLETRFKCRNAIDLFHIFVHFAVVSNGVRCTGENTLYSLSNVRRYLLLLHYTSRSSTSTNRFAFSVDRAATVEPLLGHQSIHTIYMYNSTSTFNANTALYNSFHFSPSLSTFPPSLAQLERFLFGCDCVQLTAMNDCARLSLQLICFSIYSVCFVFGFSMTRGEQSTTHRFSSLLTFRTMKSIRAIE